MISQSKLNEIFKYDPETGELRWRHDRGFKVKAGDVAGSQFRRKHNKSPYRQVSVSGAVYRVHRVIWKMVYGVEPDQIDHIDGNGLNNKIDNLRDCSIQENNKNGTLYRINKTGISCVRPTASGKWMAVWSKQVGDKKRGGSLGTFADRFDAICARKSWEYKNGFHANHGKIRLIK